jgi:hypothetical protein
MRALLLLALLCGGCHGQLIQALEQRHVSSCIWWSTPWGGKGVTATGGQSLAECLHVPCMRP